MEEGKITIFWRSSAIKSLESIYNYIAESNPLNAASFTERMICFGEALAVFPDKFGLCRFEILAKRNFHCAVFEKNYMFIFKVVEAKVIIYKIVHVSRLK